MRIIYFFLFLSTSIALYFIFNKSNLDISVIDLNKNHICASDSMIIINYNGPKAQIIWKDGSRSFYCEVREVFYELLNEMNKKKIKACYVQDFSNLEWGSYVDKWILADKVYYVINSRKDGAMGLSYVPFSDKHFAENFIELNGGELLKFNEINLNTLNQSANLLKERMM